MFDVVCIGNAKIDSFLAIHNASEHCRIDSSTGELCVKSGEKIPLDSAEFLLGGNACNVSVGLRRLGLKSGLIVEIGNDDFAHHIRRGLRKERVNITHIVSEDGPSAFSVAVNFKGERTLFSQHILRKHNFRFYGISGKWLYLTSLGKEWKHAYRDVLGFVKKKNIQLVFNPGTPQLEEGMDAIKDTMRHTRIFIVNKDEGAELLGIRQERFLEGDKKSVMLKLLTGLQKYGPEVVVVTDGKHGSFAVDAAGRYYHQGIVEAEVVEKTGAGDAYSSGLVAAMMYDRDIQTAMKWGAVNSASVIGKIGAQPGLLTKEQIMKKL